MPIIRTPRLQRRKDARFGKQVKRLEELLDKKSGEFFVTIPKTGQKISLVELRERLVENTAYSGIPLQELRQKFESQIKAFETLRSVVEDYNSGMTLEAISKKYGKSRPTIGTWINGKALPEELFSEKMAKARTNQRNTINLEEIMQNPEKQEQAGYLLGAAFGNLSIAKRKTGKTFSAKTSVKSKTFAQTISAAANEILSSNAKISARPKGVYEVTIGSVDFVQTFNRITNYGRRIPTDFLNKRRKVKEGFLRAIVDSRASIGADRSGITFQISNPMIRKYIHEELRAIGISTVFSESSRRLNIRAIDLKKFRDKIGFREPEKSTRLDAAIARAR